MNTRDLVLELTGIELDAYVTDLGLDREFLDREVRIKDVDGIEHCIDDISFNGITNVTIIEID